MDEKKIEEHLKIRVFDKHGNLKEERIYNSTGGIKDDNNKDRVC